MISQKESIKIIRQRGMDVSTTILAERGLTFREAQSLDEAKIICLDEVERFHGEEDLDAAAASLMKCYKFLAMPNKDGFYANYYAQEFYQMLCKRAEDYFYNESDSENALVRFQLAAGLNPKSQEAIKGVLTICLQGSPRRPRVALPYAVILAQLNPIDNEVDNVLELIAQEDLKYTSQTTPAQSQQGEAIPWFETSGGDLKRTGVSSSIIDSPLAIAWTCRTEEIDGGAVISNSIVVVGDREGKVHGIDLQTGSRLWDYNMGGIITGTPAVKNNKVFLGGSNHAVCLQLSTGKTLWNTTTDHEKKDINRLFSMTGCILCADDLVFFCDDEIAIFDAKTGKLVNKQEFGFEPAYHTGPCTDGEFVYMPSYRKILRLSLDSGQILNSEYTDGGITSGPMIADDLIIFGTNRFSIQAHSQHDLSNVWSFFMEDPLLDPMGLIKSRPAFSGEHLFFGAPDGNIYALKAKTGKKRWKSQLGSSIQSSPLISGEALFILTLEGLCAFSTINGKLLWKYEIDAIEAASSPASAEGFLIVGGDKLYAFKPAKAKA
ncbi:MAG: PQQ-binding-like beta-propeller repeat protein [Candidatus Aminicenantes bacterium]|nr:PQQ-binding-like beta-propeller repeat protein [Candidatus Aminicenantes bacterium]NIN23717.1 PQQ-binding-like beta-propeller repeat protein [Candidatus Aminicenantes bacterium]NIN47424.1 PQQ-binding-like beta-propeller repeat protein [Candidatus Aminicenantes bacterium]NIN90352.1 PQQ-binding-like beta-propeller repeat protein [Candidatus Aminicenantes bacterium]NIO80190.1 PQQ-binding-like beta-propeller repeat protein [Candidatus Aminicenantes bacterium]